MTYLQYLQEGRRISDGELAQLRADAARWRYVRDHLARCMSPKMDSQHLWCFRHPQTAGPTIEAAIDAAIAAQNSREQGESAPKSSD